MSIPITETSIHNYLNSIQNVINRLASNSAQCKTWCVTVISAVLIFSIDKAKIESIYIGSFLLLLFFFLDAYYLSLERDFRNIYNSFVDKLHNEEKLDKEIYLLKIPTGFVHRTKAILSRFSLSLFPFYIGISVLLLIVYLWYCP